MWDSNSPSLSGVSPNRGAVAAEDAMTNDGNTGAISDSRSAVDETRLVRRLLVVPILILAGCAQGEYRMAYEDGTDVYVNRDHVTHSSPSAYMYDLEAQNATPARVVAAAPGWIRFIDDSHTEPTSDNNYVWIEHPYPFCPVDPTRSNWPGKPADYNDTCIPCERDFCNEWTTYAHMPKDSVRVDAGLSEGDWVEAGTFLGYEDEVGDAYGVHLHWHVAVIPPDTEPTHNGYYLDYVDEIGKQPELIPIVCHQNGPSVLWRNSTYTAAPCPARSPSAGRSLFLGPPELRSPLAATLRAVSRITDEGVALALADPRLMLRTRRVFERLDPDFQDLLHLGRARISSAELEMLLDLLAEYESRGSTEMRRVLEQIRREAENPNARRNLGLIVEEPFSLD